MSTAVYPKRLIEVDLPIREISAHARREKSIRHGHISTLHIWWARRPLAACRAVLCASLWPDPADEHCPQAFRDAAALALCYFAKQVRTESTLAALCANHWVRWVRTNLTTMQGSSPACWADMRYALLDFIADFANWDASTVPAFLDTSRLLTRAAHLAMQDANWKLPVRMPGQESEIESRFDAFKEALNDLPRPMVIDPFAGGGSIPLEALRVGSDALSSDLNPVAVLLNKIELEYIPKFGYDLASELSDWGKWVWDHAEQELLNLYPEDSDGSRPIAYLWARTIKCEGPSCGVEVPLLRNLWLADKGEGSSALQLYIPPNKQSIEFLIIEKRNKQWIEQSKSVALPKQPNFDGTLRRGSVTCPICGFTTSINSVRKQLREKEGGTRDARLIAIRCEDRHYRLPDKNDYLALERANIAFESIRYVSHNGLSVFPDEPTPTNEGHRAVGSPWIYGMKTWQQLFSQRQLVALSIFIKYIHMASDEIAKSNTREMTNAIITMLSLALSALTNFSSSLCRLNYTGGRGVANTFGRQALQMVWTFMETNPINTIAANWNSFIESSITTIEHEATISQVGQAEKCDATKSFLPDDVANVFFTDPPYYDAVPYANLADFFYVWLRRCLENVYAELFTEKETPKQQQAVVLHPNSKEEKIDFEQKMTNALIEGRRVLNSDGIGVIVFAHKSTTGWETQLQAMVTAGWTVTGSWPIDTERGGRVNAQDTASLASSIHLVCRPRETIYGQLSTEVGDWREILQELPVRIHDWLPRLASEGVVGADAIFACLGPALEIFSRYGRVEKASGDQVTLKEYLEYVWAAVSREALSMIFEGADATGFEEDSRLTAMWMWTLKSADGSAGAAEKKDGQQAALEPDEENEEEERKGGTAGGFALEYDAARKIAQGLGAHMERLDHLVEIKGDQARLRPVSERARFLFGKGEEGWTGKGRKKAEAMQPGLFAALDEAEAQESGWSDTKSPEAGQTTLDRLHQSMLLFASGRNEALKAFLVDGGVGKDNRFWRLAQALSALYPSGSDEKRWVDGVMARKKGLGF